MWWLNSGKRRALKLQGLMRRCEGSTETSVRVSDDDLPCCWRHPALRCPGECQYVLAQDECIHELKAQAAERVEA
jgi:hypothetical protein